MRDEERTAKARRWSLTKLRLNAAMRHAREAEARERESLLVLARTSRTEGRNR
jgi:hypothetical protein